MSREGWLQYIPTVSRPWEDTPWDGETGRVEDILRKHVDSIGFTPKDTVAYIVGHPRMIENARDALTRARFSEESIEEEKFFQTADSHKMSQPPHPSQTTDVDQRGKALGSGV